MSNAVEDHYTRGNLLEAIDQALRAEGYDPQALPPEALAPVEEFHTFGAPATVALAEAAGISAGDHVLDVGAGLGGPARHLARAFGCRVTGIDLTRELIETAAALTRRLGLDDRVELRWGDALDLPFADQSFDVVWTQHVSMNIADKPRLFSEMTRVLRPGGRLAFFDILAGPAQPIHFPVPWATDPSCSALATPEETRALVEAQGLTVDVWEDLTAAAAEFYAGLAAGGGPPPSPLGIHLLIADLPTKGANLARNVAEDRIAIVRAVATRPA